VDEARRGGAQEQSVDAGSGVRGQGDQSGGALVEVVVQTARGADGVALDDAVDVAELVPPGPDQAVDVGVGVLVRPVAAIARGAVDRTGGVVGDGED
jgi:hypothetical protein